MQVLTIDELLDGKEVELPPSITTFKQAERVKEEGPRTLNMFEDLSEEDEPE